MGLVPRESPLVLEAWDFEGKNDASLISAERLVAHQVIAGSWTVAHIRFKLGGKLSVKSSLLVRNIHSVIGCII